MLFPQVKFRLNIIDSCESTNELLWMERGSESFHGLAIAAKKQTAGQGRRGRSWWFREGNLAVSVGIRFVDPAHIALFPFTAGIAMGRLLSFLPSLQLKWPNDIYLDGKKFAGILSQARQQGSSADIVLGLGANLIASPPEELCSVPSVALSSFCSPPVMADFAISFLREWERVLHDMQSFSSIEKEWERYARVKGAEFEVLGEEGSVRGLGLLPTGELSVLSPEGVKRVLSSEEISLRYAK